MDNPESGTAGSNESGDTGEVKPTEPSEGELQNHVEENVSAKDTSAEAMDVDSQNDKPPAATLAVPKEENEAMDTETPREEDDPTDEPSLESGANQESDPENEIPVELDAAMVPIIIQEIGPVDALCITCQIEQPCSFHFNKDNEAEYLCNEPCVKSFQAENPGKFTVQRKKYLIEEIQARKLQCSECEEMKSCNFYHNFDGEDTYYCSMSCLEDMMADEKDQYTFKRRHIIINQIQDKPGENKTCLICEQEKTCDFVATRYGQKHYLCETACLKKLNEQEGGRYYIKKTNSKLPLKPPAPAPAKTPLLQLKVISNATDKYLDERYKIQAKTPAMVQQAREERVRTFLRKCSHCTLILTIDEKVLTWETMDFCDEVCLGQYQKKIGSRCANCKNVVQHKSLGTYCVRFGYDIQQFCNSGCLEEFRKGLKICCYCRRNISEGHQGILAPVGDRGQFKVFCTQQCMEKFDQMSNNPVPQPVWAKCVVCSLEKATTIEVEVTETASQRLCSDPSCFAAFKFVNNVFLDQCRWCKKYFERKLSKNFTIYEGSNPQCFCSKLCMNVFISNSRHIVPCNWCKVQKYNFDMIRRVQANGQAIMMCSLNCLDLYQMSVNAVPSRNLTGPSGVPPAAVATPAAVAPPGAVAPPAAVATPVAVPGPSSTSTSIDEIALKCRKKNALHRKAVGRQNQKKSAELLERKECQLFLLPDAPPKKRGQKRKPSPTRVACPLTPGTPSVPPPRKLQPWEVHLKGRRQATSTTAAATTAAATTAETTASPPQKKRAVSFSPSALNVPTVDTVPEGMACGDGEEYMDFTPPPSTRTTQDQMPVSTLPLDEDDELQRVTNPGSDVDSDDDTTVGRVITDTPRAPRRENEDVPVEPLLDALDAQDDLALREMASEDMRHFEWFSDPEVFTGRREEFTGEAGPTFNVSDMSPFDVFRQIWDNDIIELIVRETNRYGQEHRAPWSIIDAEDIFLYFAVLMLQTLVICPVERDYWYPSLPYLKIGNFNRILSYKRFCEIKRGLHFVDNHSLSQNVSRDCMKLAKIMPIIEHLNAKFSSLYLPEQNIAIDESLLGWKGRLSFAQMITTKAARVGIKSYELCESRTGYLWKMIVYAGKGNKETVPESGNSGQPDGAASQIVYDLVRPLLNRGHTLVMDNFYNSPLLSRSLKPKKTDTMGTLRLNRQYVPESLKKRTNTNTRVGEVAASYTNDLSICVWRDANMVSMISTFHKVEVGGKEKYGNYKFKPQVVLDYNLSMGGVDKKDQMLQAFPIERVRNQIWYKKLFRRLLNVSIHNSFVLYKTNHPNTTQRQFRKTLAEQIIEAMRPSLTIPLHVTSAVGHFPVRNGSKYSRCKWCRIHHNKTSRTAFKCLGCNVNLCIGLPESSCFTDYHLHQQREQ